MTYDIKSYRDNSYYTGSTYNLESIIFKHQKNLLPCYTNSKYPLKLVLQQEFEKINDAIKAERQIKGWSRKKKEALIESDYTLLVKLSNHNKDKNV